MLKSKLILENRRLKSELLRMQQNSSLLLASDQLKCKIALDKYLERLHRRKRTFELDIEDVDNKVLAREYQIRLCRQIKENSF